MKFFNIKLLIIGIFSMGLLSITACTDDFEEINTNPNNPEVVPTNMIFNNATRYIMHYTRDGWWSARMSMPWMQYSGQLVYQEEDKYQYRENQTSNGWFYHYKTANDLKTIIDFCETPELEAEMSAYGNVGNQIAVSRIMMAYIFDGLASHFGDVPYWSYGSDDPDFQALQIDEYLQPKYASQSKIYPDILRELKDAAAQLNVSEKAFIAGDNIYNGDAGQWKKFANSLRLRIANRIKDVYPGAMEHINDAIASGVFESNADNAVQLFGLSSTEGSPFWQTFMVGKRQDFVVNQQFVNLLKGNTGNFGVDPRLPRLVAPVGVTGYEVEAKGYTETSFGDILSNPALLDNYIGMPTGLPGDDPERINQNSGLGLTSFNSFHIIKPDFGEVLMEYAEVEFIRSELEGWNETRYKNGVRASMEKWGVEQQYINGYVDALPGANAENVLTQKYIALYMQPQEAWAEYRRTGYPDGSVLLLPGAQGVDLFGVPYVMTPMVSGNVVATDIPSRVRYPVTEQTINKDSYQEAVSGLSNGDQIDSKLWWDVN